jgi:N-acetylglucosamine kinase-like BadF-type ATPase
MNLKPFISIDWGGTSLKGCFHSSANESLSFFNFPAGNLRQLSDQNLKSIIQKILKRFPEIQELNPEWFIGAAGGSDKQALSRISRVYKKIGLPKAKVNIYPDFQCNYASAFENKDGILSINGTGSILYIKHKGNEERFGGWGFLFDQTPSGAYFGHQSLKAVLEFVEGRSELKGFTKIFKKEFPKIKIDREHILAAIYGSENRQLFLSRFSKALTKAYDQEDQWAAGAVRTSIARLISLISKCLGQICEDQESVNICGNGGLWKSWPNFAKVFNQELISSELHCKLVSPNLRSEIGPYLQSKLSAGKKIRIPAWLRKKVKA